ncbi:hypothetical protein [Desulfogranum japonicum]|uniref:hypothetical protein n=1 Tax=Desulfogranum japonicum TaxID=231447 RepID=UPI0003FC731E|nr:hypothetical protein [Desulfogranum japonicum]
MSSPKDNKPPEIGPYVFPVILATFGLWCMYDGWFTAAPEMQEHILFNRIAAGCLIPWAIIDFYRTRKRLAKEKAINTSESTSNPTAGDQTQQ